jgi:hypothetical protein
MIDPTNITRYDRGDDDLEQFATFCVAVAGKNSTQASRKTQELCDHLGTGRPLWGLRGMEPGEIDRVCRVVGLAPYARVVPALSALRYCDLRAVTLSDLLTIRGIGHKTARMFLLHTRPGVEAVVLDVHILRWLKKSARMRSIPRATPGKTTTLYARIERRAIDFIKRNHPGVSFAQFDLATWRAMSNR